MCFISHEGNESQQICTAVVSTCNNSLTLCNSRDESRKIEDIYTAEKQNTNFILGIKRDWCWSDFYFCLNCLCLFLRDLCQWQEIFPWFCQNFCTLQKISIIFLRYFLTDTVHAGNKDRQLRFHTFFKVNLVMPNTKYWWFYSRYGLFSFISRYSNIQLQILSQCKWSLALKRGIVK